MPRSPTDTKHYYTFIRGLITEATGVTYPENAMVDGANVEVDISGICKRRKGVDFEQSYTAQDILVTTEQLTNEAITVHEWKAVAGFGDLNFWIVQVGLKLYIGTMNANSLSEGYLLTLDLETAPVITSIRPFALDGTRSWEGDITEQYYEDGIDVYYNTITETENHYYEDPFNIQASLFVIDVNKAKRQPFNTSYGKGRIFFTNKYVNQFYLEYDPTSFEITVHPFELLIRDFEGVEDGLAVDEQPFSLSQSHNYNLRNQGWTDTGRANATRYEKQTSLTGTVPEAMRGFVTVE